MFNTRSVIVHGITWPMLIVYIFPCNSIWLLFVYAWVCLGLDLLFLSCCSYIRTWIYRIYRIYLRLSYHMCMFHMHTIFIPYNIPYILIWYKYPNNCFLLLFVFVQLTWFVLFCFLGDDRLCFIILLFQLSITHILGNARSLLLFIVWREGDWINLLDF